MLPVCRVVVSAELRGRKSYWLEVAGLLLHVYRREVYTGLIVNGMSVPLTLLGLLEREPSHGYDLKRDYDTFFGRDKPLPYGQVYSTLGRLARDGKVLAG